MPSLFRTLQTLLGSNPFDDPSEPERLARAIERLSDPQANQDEVAQGIDALGSRRRPEDIDQLVQMSHQRATPDYVHQWVAEALLPSESDLRSVEAIPERVAPQTREALVDILSNVSPRANKAKPRGAA